MKRLDPARGPAIQTYTGGFFYLLDPRPDEVELADIFHALGHLPRFTGHTFRPYSVAQHSLHVANLAAEVNARDPRFLLAALLHDAHEAYLGDIATPIARALGAAPVAQLKQLVQDVIHQRVGLPAFLPAGWVDAIKVADRRALATERRDLMVPADWGDAWAAELAEPDPRRIGRSLRPQEAVEALVDRFWTLVDAAGLRQGVAA